MTAQTDNLQPLRHTVITLAKQAGEVARVDIAAHEQRLVMKADELTRGAYYRATADLLTQALHAAIDAAYETVDGVLVGCEPCGRCNAVLPWSKRSHARYALRRSQADLLRMIVNSWQSAHAQGAFKTPPVFLFDGASGKWFVNLDAYQTAETAHEAIGKWLSPAYVRKVELKQRDWARQPGTKTAAPTQRKRAGVGARA